MFYWFESPAYFLPYTQIVLFCSLWGILSNMDGDISFAYSGLGGYVGMPWNKFYYLFSDPFSMNIIIISELQRSEFINLM
ncbi:hypothetical protein BH11BAC5_BH11BAC5_27070 [soil metagenome]